jgi:hypothetical protein
MSSLDKIDVIKAGKDITVDNEFYNTLSLFLKYYFVKYHEKDFYLMNFIKDITKNENEFKVFMVFKEYSLYIYHHSGLIETFKDSSIEDIVYGIIFYVKHNYDLDRGVIKPFITSINDNNENILEKFNFIKNTYSFKIEAKSKVDKLNEAICYLEKAKELEDQSKEYRRLAMNSLYDIKSYFEKSFKTIEEPSKFLTIKNS